jgi:hypothetical protein
MLRQYTVLINCFWFLDFWTNSILVCGLPRRQNYQMLWIVSFFALVSSIYADDEAGGSAKLIFQKVLSSNIDNMDDLLNTLIYIY